MIDLRNYPEMVKAWKASDKISSKSYSAGFKYEKAMGFAKCYLCKIYEENSDPYTMEFEDRHKNCVNCPNSNANVMRHHANSIKAREEWKKYDEEVFARIIFDVLSKTKPKLTLWRTGETFTWEEVFGGSFDKSNSAALLCLADRGWGSYMWAEDVILLNGEVFGKERKELLKLGQEPEHNIDGAYMGVRDDNLTINDANEIVYNAEKGGILERHKINHRNAVISEIKRSEHRLTHNYKIFIKPQDKYMVNSLLAIFAAFHGNKEKAREYKAKAEKILAKGILFGIKRDPKLDKLVAAIKGGK